MTDVIRFFVPGLPAPQGSHKAFVRGRRAIIVNDNDAALKPWRMAVAVASDAAAAGRVFDVPVAVGYVFVFPRPKRPKFDLMAVKPDNDKLQRAINDGMQDGGLLAEDSRIAGVLYSYKTYAKPGEQVGAYVHVEAIEGPEPEWFRPDYLEHIINARFGQEEEK